MPTESPSTSGTLGAKVEADFPRLDVMAAKVVVRKLVQKGVRPGPSQLLVLEDSAYDQWLEGEAVAFLREQKARKQVPIAEIP